MRVMLDLPLAAGGVGRYARDLAKALSSIDEQIVLDAIERPSIGFLDKAFTPSGRALVWLRARASGADLLHGLHFELPAGPMPKVVTVPDLIPLQHPSSMPGRVKRKVFAGVVERSISRAAAVLVPSPGTRDALQALGYPTERVVVVPHGVGEQFSPPTARDRSLARERFAGGRHYIAAVAGPKPHKNPDLVHELARRLAMDDISVCIAGQPAHGSGPEEARYVGYLPDNALRDLFGGAEAVLVASLIEGFGLPALESVACGTPVVCGRGLGALPYLEGSVVVVDVEDPAATEEAIRSLIATPLRDRLGTEGRRIADAMSLEAMGRATLDVYVRVLG